MQMTDFEILQSFNNAAKPATQVKVLAELNACSEDRICDILKSAGVDHRKLPRKREPEVKEERAVEPATALLEQEITKLMNQRNEIQKKIDALLAAYEVLTELYIG